MTVNNIQRSLGVPAAAFLLSVILATASSAQDKSDTGRHRPEPAAEVAVDSTGRKPVPVRDPQARNWYVGGSGGVQGGSDLFRVRVLDGGGVPWDPATGAGFYSSRFTASLDRNFSFGMFVARDVGSTWTLRADFGYSRMDVAAEALIGQTGAVILYDRMSVVTLGLGAEARLTRAQSYPYAQFSVLLSHLGPVRADGLEQTNLGARLGLGYLHSFQKVWGLRFEARISGTGFSVGDYVPQSSLPGQPEIEYDTENHLVFFEFLIGIQAKL